MTPLNRYTTGELYIYFTLKSKSAGFFLYEKAKRALIHSLPRSLKLLIV